MLVRTPDFLHGIDFKTDILNQTVLTVFMGAFTKVKH